MSNKEKQIPIQLGFGKIEGFKNKFPEEGKEDGPEKGIEPLKLEHVPPQTSFGGPFAEEEEQK